MKSTTRRLIKIIIGTIIGIAISFVILASLSGARKPAIYLYPTEDSFVNVQLEINGIITKTIPKYNNGWSVFVTKDGLIEDKYDYLFYEALLRNVRLPETGWVVRYQDLSQWFDINLDKLGLNNREKNQFVEYWLKELPKESYYEIKLLEDNFLDENMRLNISPKPDTTIRLIFNFRPLKKATQIPEPIIITPERQGFTVVEWGGILGE